MDNGTLIAGAVFLVLCALPIIYMYRSVRNREGKMLKTIASMAEEVGCKITSKDVSGDLAIGLDEDASMLFVARKRKNETELSTVSLDGLKACKVLRFEHTVVEGYDKRNVLDRLDLSLTTKDGTTRNVCIFNADDRLQLYDEWNLIQKWEGRIANYLSASA